MRWYAEFCYPAVLVTTRRRLHGGATASFRTTDSSEEPTSNTRMCLILKDSRVLGETDCLLIYKM